MGYCIRTIIFLISFISVAWANVPVQGRVYIGTTTINPSTINTELSDADLKKMSIFGHGGAEILYPVFRFLNRKLLKQMYSQDMGGQTPHSRLKMQLSMAN